MKIYISLIALVAILTGCKTPPTALESKLFDVKTNYSPILEVKTNQLWVTNVQTVVQTEFVTNKQGVVITEFLTNKITVPQFVNQTVTQLVQVPQYLFTPNSNAVALQQTAGTIGNLVAPGVGGPIASGAVGLLLAGWAWIRGSKASATANNLAQTIEVARSLIKTLPNGAAYDSTLTTWMQQHQAEANVLPNVLDILEKAVDSPAAQQTAEQLKAAVSALQTPAVVRPV